MMGFGRTKSVCPVCLRVLEAQKTVGEHGIYLNKTCPEHGAFSALIWEGSIKEYFMWNGESSAIDADGKVEVDTHAARIFMPLAELVDFEKELARIAKEKANAEKQLAGIENKLKNEGFLAKAPEAVVSGARADAEKLRALIEKLDASAAAMKK